MIYFICLKILFVVTSTSSKQIKEKTFCWCFIYFQRFFYNQICLHNCAVIKHMSFSAPSDSLSLLMRHISLDIFCLIFRRVHTEVILNFRFLCFKRRFIYVSFSLTTIFFSIVESLHSRAQIWSYPHEVIIYIHNLHVTKYDFDHNAIFEINVKLKKEWVESFFVHVAPLQN